MVSLTFPTLMSTLSYLGTPAEMIKQGVAQFIAIAHITQDTAPGAIASMTGGIILFDAQSWFCFLLIFTGGVSTANTVMGESRQMLFLRRSSIS